jgi:hydrophobic/amphiphilic exporter-1 (mainly G- bacteria), HAE1 family
MNVSEPYIRRPVMTILVMMAVLIAGLLAYSQLPVSDLPNVDYPSINVKVLFPGASPEFMAKSVATPLEKEFMTIPGITHVSSSNTLGSSSIVLQFDIAKNIDSAAQDVEAAISRAKGRLPADLPNDPVYKKVNPSSTPILYLALTSDTLSLADLYTYADLFIAQRLSMINGVAQVLTYGSPYAVRIQVNPNSLASWGITLQEVASVLRQSNPHLPTGTLTGPFQAASVITKGQLERGEAYHSLIVAYRQQAPIRIRDLGKAFDSLQNG